MAIGVIIMPPDDPGGGGDGSGGGGPGVAVGTPIFDLTFYKQDASSILECQAYCNCTSNDDLQFTAYLYVDGYLSQFSTVNMILDTTSSKARLPINIFMFVPNVGVGSHNLKMTFRNLEPDSPLTVQAGATIKVTELKHAAQ